LHTADWHLGRIFYNIHLTEDQAFVLEQFVSLVKDTRPDVVVIAGDVYDRAVPPPEAVSLLNEVLSQLLLDCRLPVIVIAGNHDSPERLGFADRLLSRQGLFVVGQYTHATTPIVLEDAYGPVYFCPIPYVEPAIVRDRLAVPEVQNHDEAMRQVLAHARGQVPAGRRKVAVAHAFTAGGLTSESERLLTVGGAGTVSADYFADFSYAALGHLHRPQKVGGDHIRYAGSLLKYSFAEADQPKSVTLAEIDGSGRLKLEFISLSPRRDVRCLRGKLADILAQPPDRRDDYLMITLTDPRPIFDAMGKLRAVFPNVLHVEREVLTAGADSLSHTPVDHRRQSEDELFAAFFTQVTGEEMTVAEREAFGQLLNEFLRQEREC